MSNSNNDSAFLGLVAISQIASSIASGIFAWSLVKPESFFQAIIFLVVWGISGYALFTIVVLIIAALFSNKK